MNELALFAGAGGGILGGHLLGWRTICAVEWEPYAACVLAARQNDGVLPPFPIWDDIQTFNGRPWRGIVDVVSGGFPCQDISAAGKGAGIEGERSGMWREMARVVSEVRPAYVYVENSPMLTTRGGARVIADLTALGYDAQWDVMGAADVGAPHQRDRIWIVAYTMSTWEWRDEWQSKTKRNAEMAYSNGLRELQPQGFEQDQWRWVGDSSEQVADTNSAQCQRNGRSERIQTEYSNPDGAGKLVNTSSKRYQPQEKQICTRRHRSQHTSWWEIEPDLGRVADGVAARVDRLKAIGNGQVPAVAATAFRLLTEGL